MSRFNVKNIVSNMFVVAAYVAFCLPTASLANKPKPIQVILDTDGAFESSYATLVLALASSQSLPPVKLVGVTTSPTGEAYCNNSNAYPNLKRDMLRNFSPEEGDVNGLTQKILSIAHYNKAKIYSGCDESVAVISIPSQADDYGRPLPNAKFTSFRFQLPYGGKKAFEPCLFHQEFKFSKNDVVCWNEFNRPFRDETFKYVLPTAQNTLNKYNLSELSLIDRKKKASDFLADSMCAAYVKHEQLTVLSVGPATNLARAYEKIENKPNKYGCPEYLQLSQLKNVISTRFIGGVWDTNKADNFDAKGNYRLNEPYPIWTSGNIYFQDGSHLFSEHHLPFPGTDFENIQTGQHKKAFNSLNNAEANFWIDAVAINKILNSGIPAYIVPLNATNEARLTGFADRLQSNPRCATPSAQFMKNLQLSNQPTSGVYVYDTLFFWDTLAATSIWKDYVNFENFSDLEITTLTNGDPRTVTGQISVAELFRRDIGNLFRRGRYNHPVKLALSAKPAEGDPDFKTTIQNYVIGLACTAGRPHHVNK